MESVAVLHWIGATEEGVGSVRVNGRRLQLSAPGPRDDARLFSERDLLAAAVARSVGAEVVRRAARQTGFVGQVSVSVRLAAIASERSGTCVSIAVRLPTSAPAEFDDLVAAAAAGHPLAAAMPLTVTDLAITRGSGAGIAHV